MNDQNYFQSNRIIHTDKIRFLEEFSDLENIAMRKTFLQLKLDILSENNSGLTTYAEKKIKKDLERQLETFDEFYTNFIRHKNYSTKQKAKAT